MRKKLKNGWIGILFLGAFFVFFLTIITYCGQPAIRPASEVKEIIQPFSGELYVPSIDDFRVGVRKVVLCGAAFGRPQAMRPMLTLAARKYQGLILKCRPVGSGTPCDGRTASTFRGASVVQCFTPDGEDFAARLVREGILCGLPGQVGTTYKAC